MPLTDIPDIDRARSAFWGDTAAELATLVAARVAGVTAATLVGGAPYPSASQKSVAAALGYFHVENNGAVGDDTTDDTAAWQSTINAAVAAGGGVIAYDPHKTYLISGALVQGGANKCNSQIAIPLVAGSPTSTVVLRFMPMGVEPGWENYNVRNIAGHGPTLRSTLTGQSYSATYGVPSVIGAMTREQSGLAATDFTNVHVEGSLWVRSPYDSGMTSINLAGCISASLDAITLDINAADSITSAPTRVSGAGLIMPKQNNWTTNRVRKFHATCKYVALVPGEHCQIEWMDVSACFISLGVRDGWLHPVRIIDGQWSTSTHGIAGWDPSTTGLVAVPSYAGSGNPPGGGGSLGTIINAAVSIENNDAGAVAWTVIADALYDTNDRLRGEFSYSYFNGSGSYGLDAVPVVGGNLISVKRRDIPSPIAYTLSGASVVVYIPAGYKSFRIVAQARETGAGGNVIFRVNGDTGANYEFQAVAYTNATLVVGASVSQTKGFMLVGPGSGAEAGAAAIHELTCADYAGTTFHKTLFAKGGWASTTAANSEWETVVNKWANTAAITSITVLLNSGANFATGSKLFLYME